MKKEFVLLVAQKNTKINWNKQKIKFEKLVNDIKKKSNGYDILIPVSGGKDSTWQVYTCLKYKLNPLAFSYKPILRTSIGRKNLENLLNLGIDHIDFTINRETELYLLKKLSLNLVLLAYLCIWQCGL